MDWIDLAQNRDIWQAQILASQNSGNFLTSCELVSFTRWPLLHGVSKKGRIVSKSVSKFTLI